MKKNIVIVLLTLSTVFFFIAYVGAPTKQSVIEDLKNNNLIKEKVEEFDPEEWKVANFKFENKISCKLAFFNENQQLTNKLDVGFSQLETNHPVASYRDQEAIVTKSGESPDLFYVSSSSSKGYVDQMVINKKTGRITLASASMIENNVTAGIGYCSNATE